MEQNNISEKLKQLSKISDPNEFIKRVRMIAAEKNQLEEDLLFPINDDEARSMINTLVGYWIAMFATLPLESKEDVIAVVDKMIFLLKEFEDYLPKDGEKLKKDLLHCMRRGVTPNHWSRIDPIE